MSSLLKLIKNDGYCFSEFRSTVRSEPHLINERDNDGATPLHRACERGDTLASNLLLAWGADPNERDKHGFTPLHYAVVSGQSAAVSLMLENFANPNAKSKSGKTPLHVLACCKEGKSTSKIAELLIDYRALPKDFDYEGYQPLYYAMKSQNMDLIRVLDRR
ncbi:MAG: ankyrin repeat domain-containing protein [Patescibacteria group bacterium]